MKLIPRAIPVSLVGLLFMASAGAEDQVTNYARDSGFTACLSTVADIETFFTKDNIYGSWTFVAKEGANKQVLNATLELTYSSDSALIDLTIAPTADGNCTYSYTRTAYFDMSCLATSKESFMANATYKTEINKFIAGFEDGAAKILLMPAGKGCVIQKKEIGYRHAKQTK